MKLVLAMRVGGRFGDHWWFHASVPAAGSGGLEWIAANNVRRTCDATLENYLNLDISTRSGFPIQWADFQTDRQALYASHFEIVSVLFWVSL